MLRLVGLLLSGAILLPSSVLAQTGPLPQANRNGDYMPNQGHPLWSVVDPDPNGLNCRWSEEMPDDWYAPDAQWPEMDVVNWEIVHQFPTGMVLEANATPAGFVILMDNRGLPWLKVSMGRNDEICLVRANRAFIRPF